MWALDGTISNVIHTTHNTHALFHLKWKVFDIKIEQREDEWPLQLPYQLCSQLSSEIEWRLKSSSAMQLHFSYQFTSNKDNFLFQMHCMCLFENNNTKKKKLNLHYNLNCLGFFWEEMHDLWSDNSFRLYNNRSKCYYLNIFENMWTI